MEYFGVANATAATTNATAAATATNATAAATATNATATATATTATATASRLLIYCDGACSANGRRGAKAGFGVSVRNADGSEKTHVSCPLSPSEQQTNQRAELRGLQWSIEFALKSEGGADIFTDSEYALKCLQEWGPGWSARGWKKADGSPVQHQDLLRPMLDMWRGRGAKVRIFHVSAHTGRQDAHSRGNARADELAVASIAG
jgi:ribonuclease HI